MSVHFAAFEKFAPRKPNAPVVILFSGGLDSTTIVALAKDLGYAPYVLSVAYGQRHSSELAAAKHIAKQMGVIRHEVVNLDLTRFGGSALTDSSIAVPTTPAKEHEIPVTYVPARNTILLSLALGWAESLGGLDVFYGANAVDYSGYPDCRKVFYDAFNTVIALGTKPETSIEILTPLIEMQKSDIVRKGMELKVPFAFSWSCYKSEGKACGICDSCARRLRAFELVGVPDPIDYEERPLYI